MSERNFGVGFEDFQDTEPRAKDAGNGFDALQLHKDIPHIEAPGPKMGPDFLDKQNLNPREIEQIEKEASIEKLEKIKEVILETEIDLLHPSNTYKSMSKELKDRGLFEDEFKTDINFYFNQKLVYLYNKENLKNEHAQLTDEEKKKKKEAAFAGAKNLHDMVEKLEKIEESGGNDEKIKEYWIKRKIFYLNLKEKDTEHLLKKEEILLDSLDNAQKYGALAEKAAKDLIKNSSEYIKEMIDRDESLKALFANGLRMNIKEASIKDDVYNGIDFYLEVIRKNEITGEDEVLYFPVQVKCGSIDSRRGEDEKTQEYIMNNLVKEVGKEDKFKCEESDCFYEKKITCKLNKFIEKALFNNGYEKGLFVILPRGKQMLGENGEVDRKVKETFLEQFSKIILKLKFNQ